MTNLRERQVQLIRRRSGGDIALLTFATAIGLWLCSRLVIIAGVRGSVAGVVTVTIAALVLMAAWGAAVSIWFTRNRKQ